MLEPPVDQQHAPSSGYQVPIQQLPSAGFHLPLQGTSHSGLPPKYLAGQPIGRYDLLQFNLDTMELVRASEGHIPTGRRLVKGGYEEDGMPLYHGIAMHPNSKHRVPGKTSPRLRGCVYSYSNDVHLATDYEILVL
ncbi:uncharacterized protein EV420DRAFT_1584858 [Desarmillaria tabescens]|uniref:Uncharacterized protein n=1 Tax=Armillaria tabescens TaxID=1929756 RepID=A0AA39MMM5_ARMTA|nr:uncharacterized protein EV420DRAFT_1584858 [Desarmillaria tabescens]KAK0439025.1 hypothetical protein EV420DRAFT_1584858 [Desarmillaria tabescens]